MSDDPPQLDLEVHFNPPLSDQRRLWILNILRRENILEVTDIGCGEGALLGTLSRAAPWLASPTDDFNYLRMRVIRGLDVSADDLQFAVKATTPMVEEEEHPSAYVFDTPRWEELKAQIWKGGLENINEEFINTQCIVSSEV